MLGYWAATGMLALWLALAIACNFGDIGAKFRVHDPLGLIPEWRFFAPNPVEADLRVVYRDYPTPSLGGPWTEASVIADRRYYHAIWNPSKRQNKAFFDAMNEIAFLGASTDRSLLVGTVPYLLILNMVSDVSRSLPVAATQFAILLDERGDLVPRVVFLSRVHLLTDDVGHVAQAYGPD